MSFKTVEYVRKIRDENYEKCKNLSPKEKIEHTKKTAELFEQQKKLKD
ncbi:MAG: hypothetical protein SFH39_00795 [Candidatus Magnetobacterium sp. LHC-1]|nr:hypothetical protein [Nitrospirota bacterium]